MLEEIPSLWKGIQSSLADWFLLEFITLLTNDKRRAFHDYIAGTVVVRETRASRPA